MLSRPWIRTCFWSFQATSLPYSLPVFPLLPTLKNGSPQDSPWAVFHLPSAWSPRAPALLQSLQSSFTRLGSFPSAPHLCIGSWLLYLAFPDPSQCIQSGIHHFCPKRAPCLVPCFSPHHSIRLLPELETMCIFSFCFPPMSSHWSHCFTIIL